MSLHAHIGMQGHEEALLPGRLVSLQDRMHVQGQAARDEDNNCVRSCLMMNSRRGMNITKQS
eukprot:7164575-Prorocentrum_lima.AAC.1